MKHALLAMSLFAAIGAAHAGTITTTGFTGDFAPSQWTQSPGTGSVNAFDGSSLSITSGDDGSLAGSFTDVYQRAVLPTTYSFDWFYSTADTEAAYDPFGYITSNDGVNFTFTQLTVDALSDQQGTGSFVADAGTWFGFRAWTIDNDGGAATTRIGNFSATQVPEPGSIALVLAALAGVAATRRRAHI